MGIGPRVPALVVATALLPGASEKVVALLTDLSPFSASLRRPTATDDAENDGRGGGAPP